jgi:hypothetical protein
MVRRIYQVDSAPLSQQLPISLLPTHRRGKAESFTALKQLVSHIKSDASLTATLQPHTQPPEGHAQKSTTPAWRISSLDLG